MYAVPSLLTFLTAQLLINHGLPSFPVLLVAGFVAAVLLKHQEKTL